MLNRFSSRPLYRQLIDALEARLTDEFEAGERLPSEAELAAAYDVNRLTVRQALAEMGRRGLIETVQGKGSFVTAPPIRYEISARHGASFSHAMQASGRPVEVRRLRVGLDHDRRVKAALATRGRIVRFDLVRLVDGIPWSLTATWLPLKPFPGIDDHWHGDTSLYDLLRERYGVRMVRATRTFAALPADSVDAEHLMVPVGSPILLMRGLNVSEAGPPVAMVEHRLRGDRVEFTVELR